MSPSIWFQMEQFLHKYLIELSAFKGSVYGGSKLENVRMHSNKLKQVLDSLYEMVVAILLHTECRENFFSHQTRPAFGHMVSLLLEIFGDSTRDTSIRINAARVLEKITDVNLKQVSADSLALVLPGFFAKCQRIAIDNVNAAVPYQIPQTAVLLISQIIRSTMWSSSMVKEDVADPKSDTPVENLTAVPKFQLQVQRNSKWFEMATSKLLPQLSSLVAMLCINDSHHIRVSTLKMMVDIAKQCSVAFDKHTLNLILLDLCTVLVNDDYVEIRSLVRDVLTKLRRDDTNFCIRHMSDKISKVSKNFVKNVKDSASGDTVFQNHINCLQVLGTAGFDRLILASTDFLERLLLAVMQTIRVDKKRLLISSEESASFLLSFPLCYGIQGSQVMALAEFFGGLQNVDSVFSTLVDNFQTSDMDGRIAAAILMASIASFSPSTSLDLSAEQETIRLASLHSFVDSSLQFLLPLENSIEAEVNDQRIEDGSRLHSDESCLAAVLVHGIVRAILQLKHHKHYTRLLIDVLYEVLKWTSSSNFFVKDSAEQSLEVLSMGNGHVSVSEFLSLNASYVVFKVSLRFRDFALNARSPLILSEMLARCSDPLMFEQVQHIVQELLLALDRNDQRKTLLLLRAIRNYVRALLRWFPDLKPVPVTYETMEPVGESSQKKCDSDDEQNEQERPDLYASGESQEFRKNTGKSPMALSVVAVLNRTKHLISSTDLPIQILVLDILDDSLQFVKHFEDDLLPMIHQNWHGLVRKLSADWSTRSISDSQKLVAARAVEVVETMCKVSGNFIYVKITQELGPKIIGFMQQSLTGADFMLKTYPLTATYRLQLSVLKGISTFVLKCRLSDQHRIPFIEVLKLYSNMMKLPEELRRVAKESLKRCTEISHNNENDL